MHFYNLIKDLSDEQKIALYVDMDGVIASYDVGKPLNFSTKRPLTENIKKLEKVNTINNVELHILSICRKDYQIEEKNNWLDKNAPFLQKETRTIISKEHMPKITSGELKKNYLENLKTEKQIILLDDDNSVLKTILSSNRDIIVFQDSELID